jgi:hypothetical protein
MKLTKKKKNPSYQSFTKEQKRLFLKQLGIIDRLDNIIDPFLSELSWDQHDEYNC